MHAYFHGKKKKAAKNQNFQNDQKEVFLDNRVGSSSCSKVEKKKKKVTSRESATCPAWAWMITVVHQRDYMGLPDGRRSLQSKALPQMKNYFPPATKMGQIQGTRLYGDGDVEMKEV